MVGVSSRGFRLPPSPSPPPLPGASGGAVVEGTTSQLSPGTCAFTGCGAEPLAGELARLGLCNCHGSSGRSRVARARPFESPADGCPCSPPAPAPSGLDLVSCCCASASAFMYSARTDSLLLSVIVVPEEYPSESLIQYLPRAVQQHMGGGQFDFVRLPARAPKSRKTPHRKRRSLLFNTHGCCWPSLAVGGADAQLRSPPALLLLPGTCIPESRGVAEVRSR